MLIQSGCLKNILFTLVDYYELKKWGGYMKKKALYFIILILLLLNTFTLSKLNSMENNLNNKFQESDIVANNLKNDINNIYSNVETNLKKQGSILAT